MLGGAGPGTRRSGDVEALRDLLTEQAFLDSADGHALRTRGGATMPWVFYGPGVSLAQPGLGLIASVLLERLATFDSTQLATYGVSALPILGACVAQSGGRYSALAVRREKKPYGAGRLIDGVVERTGSVVVLDESITSGTTAYRAICALEAAGVHVEGVLCLVNISGYGAAAWLAARGYRVETVFDVWSDLGRRVDPRPSPAPVAPERWSARVTPDGLTPAQLARFTVEEFRSSGLLPSPPLRLDRDYDGAGGTFVSVRRRSTDVRLTRSGFRRWDLPVSPLLDVVLAAHLAAVSPQVASIADLSQVKFAVSFLAAPKPATLAQVDVGRHALMLRGAGPLDHLGFALPNSPHYDDEIQQYGYARSVGGSFWRFEPDVIFSQAVVRSVEHGESWPPDGAPDDEPDGQPFAEALGIRVGQLLRHLVLGADLPAGEPLPPLSLPVDGIGISIYADRLVGCALSFTADTDLNLTRAVTRAVRDSRYDAVRGDLDVGQLSVVVSVLHRRRWIGGVTPDRLRDHFRVGRDTLMAAAVGPGPARTGLVLAHFAVHQSLGPQHYAEQVLRKAGIDDGMVDWSAYPTRAWLVERGRSTPLDYGLPRRPAFDATNRADLLSLATDVAGFITRMRTDQGLLAYQIDGWTGRRHEEGTATRVLLGAAGLLEAGATLGPDITSAGADIVERLIDERRRPAHLGWDPGTDAEMLACLSLLPNREAHAAPARELIARLGALVRPDGAIYRPGLHRMTSDLDLLAGLVVLALSRARHWLPDAVEGIDLAPSLTFYRRRFHLRQPWAMVWWHAQGWAAAADDVTGAQDFAFELVDWALERQTHAGAFAITDMEPRRFSFLTGCVLEGVADAWQRALLLQDTDRSARYAQAWARGASFMERLVVRGRDTYWHQERGTLGAVRPTLVSTDLRVDYAGHLLLALAKGCQAMATPR